MEPMTCLSQNPLIHPAAKRKITPADVNVLIACEESQSECAAFLAAGCNVFSADLQACSGHFPSRHFVGDVRELFVPGSLVTLQSGAQLICPKWHLIIAHPPCTYLSKAAGNILFRGHKTDEHRFALGLQAADFFMQMYNAPAHFVCVENPIPFRIFNLPRPSCAVNPSDFGAPWLKKTLYWLHDLPPLMSTIIHPSPRSYVRCTRGGKKRSKSFDVISNAMVIQWLPVILDYYNAHPSEL